MSIKKTPYYLITHGNLSKLCVFSIKDNYCCHGYNESEKCSPLKCPLVPKLVLPLFNTKQLKKLMSKGIRK